MNISHLLGSLGYYPYWILFLAVAVEGPISTFIAGSLTAIGHFNFLIAYFVVVGADVTGDVLHYAIGRFGRHGYFAKIRERLGATPKRIAYIEKEFQKNQWKVFFLGKVLHGPGGVILVAAGFAKAPFRRYLIINFFATLVKSLVILSLGYYFGSTLAFGKYLNYLAVLSLLVIMLAGWFYGRDFFKAAD